MLRYLTAPERNARKTHCKHGHAFTKENTLLVRNNDHGGMMRQCRACHRARSKLRKRPSRATGAKELAVRAKEDRILAQADAIRAKRALEAK